MNKAVFLDRDGVLNPLVYNLATCEYESPHYPEDFSVYPYIVEPLRKLISKGYLLFLVSNQPSYAKGKTSLENIKAIHNLLEDFLCKENIIFKEFYYCYHHPNGVIPEYTCKCRCRKPNTLFLEEAMKVYALNMEESWFIGDQDSDVQCGETMGLKTILLQNKHSVKKRIKGDGDFLNANLEEAVETILDNMEYL